MNNFSRKRIISQKSTGFQISQFITNGDTSHAPSGDVVYDALSQKVDLSSWVDYSLSSTVVGFSGVPTVSIKYLDMGNVYRYHVNISGTSNSATFSFTTHANHNGVSVILPSIVSDNGINNNGRFQVINGSNVVTFGKAVTGSGGFTTSGVKGSWLQFDVYK